MLIVTSLSVSVILTSAASIVRGPRLLGSPTVGLRRIRLDSTALAVIGLTNLRLPERDINSPAQSEVGCSSAEAKLRRDPRFAPAALPSGDTVPIRPGSPPRARKLIPTIVT